MEGGTGTLASVLEPPVTVQEHRERRGAEVGFSSQLCRVWAGLLSFLSHTRGL